MVLRPRRSVSEQVASGRSIGDVIEEELGHLQAGPFDDEAFPSRLHDARIAALLGIALGVAFGICFLTGLVSHFAQEPWKIGFLSMPASPSWLYRWTQGLHVVAGIAAIPLLLVKLWVVYPKLFTWPPVEDLAHGLRRLSLLPLVAGSIFQLMSGLLNSARWYPWEFAFRETHYWTAWIVVGSLLIHVGAQLTIVRRSVGAQAKASLPPEEPGEGLNRRGLLAATGAAVAAVTLTTIGQTFRPLKELALLAPRAPDIGPQGLPVNRTAAGAGVLDLIDSPAYRLTITGRVPQELSFTLDELRALPQHTADLAITCVEGWSAGATWTGVRVRDLLDLAGADPEAEVVVRSLQTRASFRSRVLTVPHARHDDTLLALKIGDEDLHPDHGFPCRLIAPNRPGVQQTKWVTRLEVV